jgi:hypothetical protein
MPCIGTFQPWAHMCEARDHHQQIFHASHHVRPCCLTGDTTFLGEDGQVAPKNPTALTQCQVAPQNPFHSSRSPRRFSENGQARLTRSGGRERARWILSPEGRRGNQPLVPAELSRILGLGRRVGKGSVCGGEGCLDCNQGDGVFRAIVNGQ